jgi:hypothetical protein
MSYLFVSARLMIPIPYLFMRDLLQVTTFFMSVLTWLLYPVSCHRQSPIRAHRQQSHPHARALREPTGCVSGGGGGGRAGGGRVRRTR